MAMLSSREDTRQIRVAVLIKALNEEQHIARCIESALASVADFRGEVVLADSGSIDSTIRIASAFPIRIVQLADLSERSCGIGAQLGYQFVEADYVYVLDGDMELIDGFLARSVETLERIPALAGVGGLVEELGGGNYEFEVRKGERDGRIMGRQTSLDMGGLYRVEAIRKVGYLTNRNLHSCEEKELGQRLLQAGYALERIPEPAIRHHGETDDSLRLLGRRWKSHHIDGPGEWMRSAWKTTRFPSVAMRFKQLWVVFLGWLALAASVAALPVSWLPLGLTLLAHCGLLLRLTVKRRSIRQAAMGFVHLQFYTAGMVRGLFRRQSSPGEPIGAVVLKRSPE